MRECIICGKPIGTWESFATLAAYDESSDGEIALVEWGEEYICEECWEKIVKHAEEIKKILEEDDK